MPDGPDRSRRTLQHGEGVTTSCYARSSVVHTSGRTCSAWFLAVAGASVVVLAMLAMTGDAIRRLVILRVASDAGEAAIRVLASRNRRMAEGGAAPRNTGRVARGTVGPVVSCRRGVTRGAIEPGRVGSGPSRTHGVTRGTRRGRVTGGRGVALGAGRCRPRVREAPGPGHGVACRARGRAMSRG